jgi:hypothetical protein
VSPAQARVTAGTASIDIQVQPVSAGEANITFQVPDTYVAPAPVHVTVQGGQIYFSGPQTLGKDLETAFSMNLRAAVTVTSSDPSRVLVSATPLATGQPSVTVTEGTVYAQALADSGSVNLTAAAPGYQSTTVRVALSQSQVVIGNPNYSTSLTTLSPPFALEGRLTPTSGGTPQARRPGSAPLTVPIMLSDPGVGTVTPAQLTFNPGDSSAPFSFRPLAAGSELISLGVPAGFADAQALRQLLVTVTAARLILNGALAVGKDLQAPVSATLSGANAQPTTIGLSSSNPALLKLAGQQGAPDASVNLTFAAGTSSGATFYLVGLADSGSVAITGADGVPIGSFSVTLQPSGFRFAQPSATVTAGRSTTVQIVPAMLAPGGLTPVGDLALRSDLTAPVAVTVTGSDSSIVSVPSTPVSFYAGDRQQGLTIVGVSPGVATLTITTPAGWLRPAGSYKMSVIVQ